MGWKSVPPAEFKNSLEKMSKNEHTEEKVIKESRSFYGRKKRKN